MALALRYALQIHTKDKNTEFHPSRLFIWYWAKYVNGSTKVQYDVGCQIRDAIKSLAQQGCPPETLWPYPDVQVKFTTDTEPQKLPDKLVDIPAEAAQAAQDYLNIKFQYFRIKEIEEIKKDKDENVKGAPTDPTSRVTQIKACIAEGYPVIFGIKKRALSDGKYWAPYREVNCVDQGGIRVIKEPPEPRKGESLVGGHAMVITGFNRDINRDPKVPMKDKLPGAFEVQNSWQRSRNGFPCQIR